MSPAQQRGLALWAALLSAVVCLWFLPASRLVSVLVLLAVLGLIMAFWAVACRRVQHDFTLCLEDLPETSYCQPVVLVCGDLPLAWPHQSPVLTVTQGCWIRVEDHLELEQAARQVLWLRPDWGRLTSRLLALRWQISRLRKATGHSVPLVLNGQVGSAMMNDMLWQTAILGEGVKVWSGASAPGSVAEWVNTGGTPAMHQQVLMNSLMSWFQQHVHAVLMDENPDIPVIEPVAVLWGLGPILAGSMATSVWTAWLSRHTAMQQVSGWQPAGTDSTVISLFPNFVLPLLPEGRGLTPHGRTWRGALGIVTLATIAALLSSGWNNRQLLQRVSFDIVRYNSIAMDDYGPKASAVQVLREDAALLDEHARNGVPARLGLGLYRGERLRIPVLEAIRSYVPPPPPPKPVEKVAPKIIRLDSMSLFDTGKWALKPASTKLLVNSLVGIKAKPGWLIVVAGHTDSTGDDQSNQVLSLKRAESVRDWMRDTGDVPESCFAVQGYGESRPVATNDTAEGRALNRRVEISLVPQANACQLPGNPPASSQDDGADNNLTE
ncbi:OmpA family protein [Enterobacter hormaechei subsp. hoffmannii]|uniref:OmpA family protein n=1 Tax=Enterobacter hormaechei TaxID=158836 RepID=UPI0018EB982E|nr:OmpA family protein [Enterobacter hormaechei]MBJ6568226.1 OmpA family protein [Enterobacter hormaechei]MCU3020866.1 OmpA family protein [Enterobacter hormaechei subsp. hoffmannii]MCU4005201.1 OmpA family protein [Enterobacter hormaechei subsp. hoffmannii]